MAISSRARGDAHVRCNRGPTLGAWRSDAVHEVVQEAPRRARDPDRCLGGSAGVRRRDDHTGARVTGPIRPVLARVGLHWPDNRPACRCAALPEAMRLGTMIRCAPRTRARSADTRGRWRSKPRPRRPVPTFSRSPGATARSTVPSNDTSRSSTRAPSSRRRSSPSHHHPRPGPAAPLGAHLVRLRPSQERAPHRYLRVPRTRRLGL